MIPEGEKPEPPAQLWERMAKEIAALPPKEGVRRPADSFTVKEYAEAMKWGEGKAYENVAALFRKGVLKRKRIGPRFYYYFS